MNSVWKDLVLKFLNCFVVDSIKTIKDVKSTNFLQVLYGSNASKRDDEPFKQLLLYLHETYPKYDSTLLDSNAWTNDEDLLLVASLFLLHASIDHPSDKVQRNVTGSLNGPEQALMLRFLEGAMSYGHQLTREELIDLIEASNSDEPVKGNTLAVPETCSPNLTSSPAMNLIAPLEKFLASPDVLRRKSGGFARARLFSVEMELVQEQAEKQELEQQFSELNTKYQKKLSEFKLLEEALQGAEEGHEVLNEENGHVKEEKRRLHQNLLDSEKYVKNLEEELEIGKTNEEILKQNLSVAKETSGELSALINVTREELTNLEQQMSEKVEENAELRLKCSQLERDLNDIQVASLNSPNRCAALSPVFAPENLGFVLLEEELIEKKNENIFLKEKLSELTEELKRLKSAYTERENNNEAAIESENVSCNVSALMNDRVNLESEVSQLKVELQELQQQCEDKTLAISDLKAEVASARAAHAPAPAPAPAPARPAKSYPCTWEGCKKVFPRSDSLARHMLVHTKVKKYHCEECGSSFGRADHLKSHMKTHMKNKDGAQPAQQQQRPLDLNVDA